jgi:hypothetical protein
VWRRHLRQRASVLRQEFATGARRPMRRLAAFSSVDIRPGIPPSSALQGIHLGDSRVLASDEGGESGGLPSRVSGLPR